MEHRTLLLSKTIPITITWRYGLKTPPLPDLSNFLRVPMALHRRPENPSYRPKKDGMAYELSLAKQLPVVTVDGMMALG